MQRVGWSVAVAGLASFVTFGAERSPTTARKTIAAAVVQLSFSKTLDVDIKNDRDESILLTSNAEFYLSPTDTTEKESVFAYWSPVDLRTCAIRQPNEPGSSIGISPKGRGRCVFPPDALRWAKEIAAVWPDERLAKVVPAGAYILSVRVGQLVSNQVRVHVHYSGQVVPIK
jgi:hypothetical protein